MSVEMHVFIAEEKLPTRSEWQGAIDGLGLPIRLDPTLNLLVDSGFSPCHVREAETGFEIGLTNARELVPTYPGIGKRIGARNKVVSFFWGGDLAECACVLAAAAGLVQAADGIAYSPSDDLIYDLERLVAETQQCLEEIK
jgi:hypothetical protein